MLFCSASFYIHSRLNVFLATSLPSLLHLWYFTTTCFTTTSSLWCLATSRFFLILALLSSAVIRKIPHQPPRLGIEWRYTLQQSFWKLPLDEHPQLVVEALQWVESRGREYGGMGRLLPLVAAEWMLVPLFLVTKLAPVGKLAMVPRWTVART